MQEVCIFAKDTKINGIKDIYDVILSKNLPQNIDQTPINLNNISNLIHKCQIKPPDIDILRELWGIDIIDKEGER